VKTRERGSRAGIKREKGEPPTDGTPAGHSDLVREKKDKKASVQAGSRPRRGKDRLQRRPTIATKASKMKWLEGSGKWADAVTAQAIKRGIFLKTRLGIKGEY